MKGERTVAGLRCGEVLERLSEYFDGSLAAVERDRVEAHVRECEHCARFGGVFAEAVRTLRRKLTRPEPLDADARERLRSKLDDILPRG